MLQSDELHQREGEVWEVVAAQVEVAQLRQTAQLGRREGGGERGSLAVETTTCTQCVYYYIHQVVNVCIHQVVTLYASSFT